MTKHSTHEKKVAPKPKREHEIPAENHFVLRNGASIGSIKQLAMMLGDISDEEFSFHVNDEKNDFSNWIKDVFGKEELATELRPIKDRKDSQIALLKHIATER